MVTAAVGLYAEYYHPPREDPLMEPVVQFDNVTKSLWPGYVAVENLNL